MPDVRADCGVNRRWRLPALLTGITLVSGVAVVRSTVERLHDRVSEVRRLRARLAERRREVDRQRQELAAVAIAVDGLVPGARSLGSRATKIRQAGGAQGTSEVLPELGGAPASHVEDGTVSVAMHALAALAWVDGQIAAASDAVGVENVLARKRAEEARDVLSLWPVRGAVSSPFGWRASPYGGAPEWHPGVDIRAPYGTPVVATADGEVVFAGHAPGYGSLVIVEHGAATTRYAHLSAIWVHRGQSLARGEPLGALGRTGRATAPHLHYEVRVGSVPLDPACFLTGPEMTALTRGARSRSCALAFARLDGQHVPATTKTPRAGAAGL